jgi:NitT/TauT family transport system ATP-binding protein
MHEMAITEGIEVFDVDRTITEPQVALHVHNVNKVFENPTRGPVEVLARTSIQATDGELLCLVGPSGCGKTTILNMAAGLVTPTEGTVTLNGSTPSLGNHDVGYLMARDSLLPWRTARQNVMLPLWARGVPRAEARERADEALRDVGLGSFVTSYPGELSHGMRQRCALARTLVTRPRVLLMDEPFSALDAETRLQLQQRFLELWDTLRPTVLFVTHDLSEAIALGDRIAVMSARPGRIKQVFDIALPRPRNLLELQGAAEYHELFQSLWRVFREEVTL